MSKKDLWRRVKRFVCHFDGKELSRGETAMLAAFQDFLSDHCLVAMLLWRQCHVVKLRM